MKVPRISAGFSIRKTLIALTLTFGLAAAVVNPGSPANAAETKFTIAVFPDTQAWTAPRDNRFANATEWLARNKRSLNLKFVGHTGDISNWGWLDRPQFEVARNAMGKVRAAGVPMALAAGNHDTRAVGWDNKPGSRGYGGGAYMYNPECKERFGKACHSNPLLRETWEFTQYFGKQNYGALRGTLRDDRSENSWSTFEAGGKRWMVMTLELWPRQFVLNWARDVIIKNPGRNVIILTHSFQGSDARIQTNNGGYGDTSPETMWNSTFKKLPQVKLIFSGHVGQAGSSAITKDDGRPAYAYLTNSPGGVNPIRLLEIDTAKKTLRARIYSPMNNQIVMPENQRVYRNVHFF